MPDDDVAIPGLIDPVEIGRGGFGVVYRAEEVELGREVAVKVLTGNLDEQTSTRFERERRAMGVLSSHPNIVTIFRSGTAPTGKPYLVMEYLPGGSLADRLGSTGALNWSDVLGIGIELCGALESAHRAGVLHRDVKPGNIMIDGLGRAKLGDFGIARLDGGPETRSSIITASVAHAPPEVIAGDKPDERSDVYSLASTLYELASGSPAFVRPADESMIPLFARIAQESAPDLRRQGVPGALASVLEKAMSKDRADRHRSAEELGRALIDAQRGLGLPESRLWVAGSGEPAPPVDAATRIVAPPPSTDQGAAPPVTPPGSASASSPTPRPPQGPELSFPPPSGQVPAGYPSASLPASGPSGPSGPSPHGPAGGSTEAPAPGGTGHVPPPGVHVAPPPGVGVAPPPGVGATPPPGAPLYDPGHSAGHPSPGYGHSAGHPSPGYGHSPGHPSPGYGHSPGQAGGSQSRVGLLVTLAAVAVVVVIGGVAAVLAGLGRDEDGPPSQPDDFAVDAGASDTGSDSDAGSPSSSSSSSATSTSTTTGSTTATTTELPATPSSRSSLLADLPSLPSTESPYLDYKLVSDSEGSFILEVPTEWVDELPTPGQVLTTPDNNAALANAFPISGGVVSGTQGVGVWDPELFLDTFLVSLEDPNDPCSEVTRGPYDDGVFDGLLYAEWCSGGELLVVGVLAADPDRFSVMLVAAQMTDERDMVAFQRMLDSFILLDPSLLPESL